MACLLSFRKLVRRREYYHHDVVVLTITISQFPMTSRRHHDIDLRGPRRPEIVEFSELGLELDTDFAVSTDSTRVDAVFSRHIE